MQVESQSPELPNDWGMGFNYMLETVTYSMRGLFAIHFYKLCILLHEAWNFFLHQLKHQIQYILFPIHIVSFYKD